MIPLLSVDKNVSTIEREMASWGRRRVVIVQTQTMQEAIAYLEKSDYLFVAINADNINYIPQLRVMRDVTAAPIFIIGSEFSTAKEVEAISNGADVFTLWRESSEDNVRSALAILQRYTERSRQHKNALKVLHHGDILMVLDYHKVFINDIDLPLTKTEFDILYCLMLSRGSVLTYKQIYQTVYREEYDENNTGILFSAIKRLRKKIREAAHSDAYVENVREIGYRMPAKITACTT